MSSNIKLEIEYPKTVNPFIQSKNKNNILYSCILHNSDTESCNNLKVTLEGDMFEKSVEFVTSVPGGQSV